MGANSSRTLDNRADITTVNTANRPSVPNYWSAPSVGPDAAPLAPKAPSTNRVVAFHSTASWRTYFEASKGSNKLILVDFTAAWCRSCRYMEPIFNEFAAKYTDVEFLKIDVDELFNVSCEYGIQAMPTFMFIQRGKEVDKVVGARKEELQRKIEKHSKIMLPKAPSTNQVVVFHSAASWRTYFEASKGSNKLILVNFTAIWCGPCRYMEPTLNEFAAKYTNVDIVKIDVEELCNVSREYGVQAMPTFLFMKRGKEVDKVVGAKKEELQNKIEKHKA